MDFLARPTKVPEVKRWEIALARFKDMDFHLTPVRWKSAPGPTSIPS